jgi:hypothetical protein
MGYGNVDFTFASPFPTPRSAAQGVSLPLSGKALRAMLRRGNSKSVLERVILLTDFSDHHTANTARGGEKHSVLCDLCVLSGSKKGF